MRKGPGPVYRFLHAIGRSLAAAWLGVAHGLGAVARRVGGAARDLEPWFGNAVVVPVIEFLAQEIVDGALACDTAQPLKRR